MRGRNNLVSSRNFICLISLAFIGDTVLIFSFSGNTASDIVGFVTAVAATVLVAVALKGLADFYSKLQFRHKEILDSTIKLLLCTASVYIAFLTAYNFSSFAARVMLDNELILLPFVIMLALGVLTALKGREVLYKIGLILFVCAAVFIILIFGFSMPFMNVKYLSFYEGFSADKGFDFFKDFFLSLSPLVIPAVFLGKAEKKSKILAAFSLGGGLLALSFIGTLAVFGTEFASTLQYPYYYAVSTAEFGELFYRMDGFLYALGIFSVFAKISVFILTAFLLLKDVLNKIIFRKS